MSVVVGCRLDPIEWRAHPPLPIIMVAFVPAAAIAARTASPSSTCRSRGSVASTFAAGSSPALLSAPVSAPAPAAVAGLTMAAKREGVPLNLFRPKTPYNATVLYNGTLVGKDAPGETMHIVMNHDGNVPYLEGQSIGVMAPGVDAKGKPHKVRLYSIASTRHGDFGDGKTVSLSVKRLVYEDEEGKEVKGVCSNFLCDLQPGDKVAITGPVGTAMLMPEDPNATIIMLATGTGIAPFRTYMRRAFTENNPDFKFNGKMWLFLGYVERMGFVLACVTLLAVCCRDSRVRLWCVVRIPTLRERLKLTARALFFFACPLPVLHPTCPSLGLPQCTDFVDAPVPHGIRGHDGASP